MTDPHSGPDGSADTSSAEPSGAIWTRAEPSADETARPAGPSGDGHTGEATYPVAATPGGFRSWRGRRPFWGGLLVTLAGIEMTVLMKTHLDVVIHLGLEGLAGFLVPVLLLLVGLLLIFNPAQRMFYSVLAVLFSLGSWITSDLGGFIVGLLLGMVGGSLAFGWLPEQERRRKRSDRARDKAAMRALDARQEDAARRDAARQAAVGPPEQGPPDGTGPDNFRSPREATAPQGGTEPLAGNPLPAWPPPEGAADETRRLPAPRAEPAGHADADHADAGDADSRGGGEDG